MGNVLSFMVLLVLWEIYWALFSAARDKLSRLGDVKTILWSQYISAGGNGVYPRAGKLKLV